MRDSFRRLVFVAALVAASGACAQTWERVLGPGLGEAANSVEPLAGGGFLACVAGQSFTWDAPTAWLLTLDDAGNLLSQNILEGMSSPIAIPTADGGMAIAGRGLASASAGFGGFRVVKLDASGRPEWDRVNGGATGEATPSTITQTADGGYLLCGQSRDFGATADHFWVVRLDALGNLAWHRVFGGASSDYGRAAVETSDGGVMAVGTTRSFGAGGYDAWCIRLDASGVVVWERTYGGANHDHARGVRQTSDGGFVVVGDTSSFGPVDPGLWVLKLDASGAIQWQKAYEATQDPKGEDIVQTADGGYAVCGHVVLPPSSGARSVLLRLDASGNIVQDVSFGGYEIRGVRELPGGGFVLAAMYGLHAWILRTDANCNIAGTCAAISNPGLVAVATAAVVRVTNVPGTSPPVLTGSPTTIMRPTFAAAGVAGADSFEPDDACATTFHAIRPGDVQSRNFCDDPDDWVRFNARAGSSYELLTSSLGPAANTTLRLYSGDCSTALAFDDDGGGGLASRLDWTAPASGTYFVQVHQADGSSGPDRSYTLTLTGHAPIYSTWSRAFLGPIGIFSGVAQLDTGDFVIVGKGDAGAIMLRLDASGGFLGFWNVIDPDANVHLDSVEAVASGGAIAVGLRQPGPGSAEPWLVRLDDSGNITWQQSLGPADSPPAGIFPAAPGRPSVDGTRDGGFVVAAEERASGAGLGDGWVVRLDASGNVLWQQAHGGPAEDYFDAIHETADGGFIASGATKSFGVGGWDAWMAKLDARGLIQWQVTDGSPADDTATGIAEVPDGYVVSGTTSDPAVGGSAAWVMKLDLNGAAVWKKLFAGPGSNTFRSIGAMPDGGVLLAGSTETVDRFEEAWIVRLDAAGDVLWQKAYGGAFGLDLAMYAVPTADGGGIFAGFAASLGDGFFSGWVVRFGTDGVIDSACPLEATCLLVASAVTPNVAASGATMSVTSAIPTSTMVVDMPYGVTEKDQCDGNRGFTLRALEVSPPGAAQPLVFQGKTRLAWESASLNRTEVFNLYRGDIRDLASGQYGSCLQSGIAMNSTEETSALPGNGAWFYLVTGENFLGEGPMGQDSRSASRANVSPCP